MVLTNCIVKIDGKIHTFAVDGEFNWGDNVNLFKIKNNIISKTSWLEDGFNLIKDCMDDQQFKSLYESTRLSIIKIMNELGINLNESEFELKNYHKYVSNDLIHNEIIKKTRNFSAEDFNFDISELLKKFEDELSYRLSPIISSLNRSHIQVRINRPKSLDINPPHKDGYLKIWEDVINIWLPIEGCNERTSLPIIPGSHMLSEDKILKTQPQNARINGNLYNVPCILKTSNGNLEFVRQNPKPKDALMFSPFLIHGAGFNESDITRVAFELRFHRY